MNVNYTNLFDFRPIPSITPASDYWQNSTWKFNIPEITADTAYAPSFIDVILKGVTALTLVNSKTNGLNYLKLFGGTELLPEQYLDTVTLSGGCVQRNLPVGYTQLEYIESTGTQYIDTGIVPTVANETEIRMTLARTSQSTISAGLGGNSNLNIFNNNNNWRFNAVQTSVPIVNNQFVNIVLKQTSNGRYYKIQTTEGYGSASEAENNFYLGRLSGSENDYSFNGKYKVCTILENGTIIQNLIPARRNSDNELGMYDTVTGHFLINQGEGTFTAGADVTTPSPDTPIDIVCNNGALKVNGQGQIYTDGTQEVVTDSLGNTATAERLLAVGDYKDTQEVITGSVRRNVGILVLNGTEEWNSATLTNCYSLNDTLGGGTMTNRRVICTHLGSSDTLPDADARQGLALIGNISGGNPRYTVGFGVTTQFPTTSAWNAYLAQQYANGTPVIVIYPTSSTTTSTVTGQFLSKSPVTQTAGSISNLPIAITESEKTVPTPQQPLDINCNNGVLKVSKNLLNNPVYTQGYVNSAGIIINSTGTALMFYPVSPNTTYTFTYTKGSVKSYYDRIAGYSSNDVSTLTEILSQKDFRSYSEGDRLSSTFTTGGNTNYIVIGMLCGNGNGVAPTDAQLELGSTATPYRPYGQIYTDGTVETVEIDTTGDTATAEKLLKVGDYQDEQEVLDGEVTRNVGIKVLDGSENWQEQGSLGGVYWSLLKTDLGTDNIALPNLSTAIFCTHYQAQDAVEVNKIIIGASYINFVTRSTYTTLNSWKQYLASQYQAGHPVIVVYPLRTPTEETVTAQPLTIRAGNNIVSITQASMDDLPLEVSYKAGVSVTITEVENAQLDNNVEVTING